MSVSYTHLDVYKRQIPSLFIHVTPLSTFFYYRLCRFDLKVPKNVSFLILVHILLSLIIIRMSFQLLVFTFRVFRHKLYNMRLYIGMLPLSLPSCFSHSLQSSLLARRPSVTSCQLRRSCLLNCYPVMLRTSLLVSLPSVSYTHLDVYKRQVTICRL